ncbi:27549_t:CDS:2 [Racocetra persica]|uniref:27549_t:CDS:1 n=1 Tax=Racocetra persica TaxID=160502 RepID=A0ACA9PM93_9GLOM|nr:27549_t:CDS:2 [Racocetra persica]
MDDQQPSSIYTFWIYSKAIYCGISVEMDGFEDDLVFNYEALGEDLENVNEENIEELDDINDEEYEETRGNND